MSQPDRVNSTIHARAPASRGVKTLVGVAGLVGMCGLLAVGSDQWIVAGYGLKDVPRPAVWTATGAPISPHGLSGDERFWLSQPSGDKAPTPVVQPLLQPAVPLVKGFALGQRVTLAHDSKMLGADDKTVVSREFVVVTVTQMPPTGDASTRLVMVTLHETGAKRVVRLLVDADPVTAVDKAL
jgi:hypothetical protein